MFLIPFQFTHNKGSRFFLSNLFSIGFNLDFFAVLKIVSFHLSETNQDVRGTINITIFQVPQSCKIFGLTYSFSSEGPARTSNILVFPFLHDQEDENFILKSVIEHEPIKSEPFCKSKIDILTSFNKSKIT